MSVKCGTPLPGGARCDHAHAAHALVPPFECRDWRPAAPAIEGELALEDEPCPCPGWSPRMVAE